MKIPLKLPQWENTTEKTVRNLMDSYYVMHKQILNLLDGMLGTDNVQEITASKISAGIIKATIEMISPLITGGQINGGTITGGTLRTAATGKRMEITENLLKIYNASNKLSGMNISEEDAKYGDLSFYSDGNLAFEIFNDIDGFSLKPKSGYPLIIGVDEEHTRLVNVSNAEIDTIGLKEQATEPDEETGHLKLYWDGTDLKAKLPDGTVKTVTLT